MPSGRPSNIETKGLHKEPKIITANLSWRRDGRRYKLEANVLATESKTLLKLVANIGIKNRSTALLCRNIRIRGYCTSHNHINPLRIPIRSPHKHKYDEVWGDDEAYIPDDIAYGDVNNELLGFLEECNISLLGNYQSLLLTH